MKNNWFLRAALIFLALFGGWGAAPAAAQSDGLQLRLNRDFGYSSGTGKIQGTFSMRVTGPPDLQRVVFYIDAQAIGEADQAPFNLRFTTSSYPLGRHVMRAEGFTAGGATLHSNEIEAYFVSAEEGWQAGLSIAGPLLAVTFGLLLLSAFVPLIGGGKLKQLPPGAPRQYGMAGGAICKRCGRPFPRHVFAPNLIAGKLERCPYCGKWAVVSAQPLAALRAAEAAEVIDAQAGALAEVEDQDARLRKQLDDSRFQ